ncbi:hypothetical protein GCM10022291_25580 [Postechiella marina]|uniref:Uncharacterized protein n=1 Tax=Postechiella marina TaxID=943941 RepID=A0ABP8CCZ1_9FLAO
MILKYLTENFNFITYGLELLAAIVGAFCYGAYKNTTTKWFIYFLFYVVFVECVGASLMYFRAHSIIKFINRFGVRSTSWYNLFWFFGSTLFLLVFYYKLVQSKLYKQLLLGLMLVFVIIFAGYTVFNFQGFLKSHPLFYSMLCAGVILLSVSLYFIDFIKRDAIIKAFSTFSFYISIVFLVWWIIIAPTLIFNPYNTENDWDFVNLKRRIFLFSNMFMYLTYTFALIWCRPEQK